ncbi:3-hydroxyacyl-CoA dehydrogenase family protein [Micromonospora parathelypteridis]|uniref:3-hydroxybutyryl-CoA dehydrogenase n=1 Tax=Micromonospora parathelypteridis TaxID=1839617 RepID=A0A840W6V0_9ACTN|nr:3-hydroxyacyl-CoA dehydrogenase NAD-binding domain-containing protein [Micromonospora parathelypteridis]MBB5480788.1 3-hydroxybutyryl-CoA dehydrogenase [Micromonospora parathelypteridis]GGO21622.1 3-hydroxybutyryl-CoA dehydrogenase [Micromonospora parathelypteridis]
MKNIGVVGAGTMGIGVSHLFAAGGFPVVLVDVDEATLERAARLIERNVRLYRMLDPASNAQPAEVLSRIELTTDLKRLADADFVVENVTEDWAVKGPLYVEMDRICPEHCVFGVNTSAIPITKVAGHAGRADRVIGTHFMNPAPIKPLVEVIRGYHTSDATIAGTRDVISRAGKDSVVVNDSPGFVTNRVAMMTVNEAICLLDEGVSTAADIDRLFVECFGHKMGPLATADLIGLDTVLYSLEVLQDHFRDQKFRPSQLLCKLVYAGHHGVKTGRGFFTYNI